MQMHIIRNAKDGWNFLSRLLNGETSNFRFEGWPIRVVRVTLPIDNVKAAEAVTAQQRAVFRQFCMLRYGSPNLRRLTAQDKADLKIVPFYHTDGCGISIDCSAAMNAIILAVQQRNQVGAEENEASSELFDEPAENIAKPGKSWPEVAGELGGKWIAKFPRQRMSSTTNLGIICAALVIGCPALYSTHLANHLAVRQVDGDQQLKMAELEKTTIISKAGQFSQVAKAALASAERNIDAENCQAFALITSTADQHEIRFVLKAGFGAVPLLLELAPRATSISVNGAELPGKAAAALAKAARKHQAADRPKVEQAGWTTEVRLAKPIRT